MRDDLKCPYCGEPQEINHDDGYGYEEGELYNQQCSDCDKFFTYTTSILFYYEADKADCLNDGEHKYKTTTTYPIECTRMKCTQCDEERQPTAEEMKQITQNKTLLE